MWTGSGAYVVIDKRTKKEADTQETSSDDGNVLSSFWISFPPLCLWLLVTPVLENFYFFFSYGLRLLLSLTCSCELCITNISQGIGIATWPWSYDSLVHDDIFCTFRRKWFWWTIWNWQSWFWGQEWSSNRKEVERAGEVHIFVTFFNWYPVQDCKYSRIIAYLLIGAKSIFLLVMCSGETAVDSENAVAAVNVSEIYDNVINKTAFIMLLISLVISVCVSQTTTTLYFLASCFYCLKLEVEEY